MNWAPGHERTWRTALERLNAAGWMAQLTCAAAPVQVEGIAPGGERFYFRARHDAVLLAVGGDDPADRAPWEGGCEYGRPGHHDASYLPPDPGIRLLLNLCEQYLREAHSPE